jgi:hypothetical protein
MAINMMMNGMRTRNHDRGVTPALQIKFKIQVHKRTTAILMRKMTKVLDTWQL